MPLVFGAALTDRVEIAANTLYDSPTAYTIMAWVSLSTLTGGRLIVGQGSGAGNTRRWILQYDNTSGNLRCQQDRATSDLVYVANGGMSSTGVPYFVACTFNSNNAANSLVSFYRGTLDQEAQLLTNGTTTDGSGAFVTGNGTTFCLGNLSANNSALNGTLWGVAICNTDLSTGELRRVQTDWGAPVRNLIGKWVPGKNGTGRVLDESGYNNHGTITGATISSAYLPRVMTRRRVA